MLVISSIRFRQHGFAMSTLLRDAGLLSILRSAIPANKPTTTVCSMDIRNYDI